MRASRLALASFVVVGSACALAACSATSQHTFTSGVGGSTESSSGAGGTGTGTLANSSSVASGLGPTSTSGTNSTGTGGMPVSSAYAHTATTLFTIDPAQPTLPPVEVGNFDCLSGNNGEDYSMTDLAVNEAGDLWGISSNFVYPLQVMGTTVHCVASYKLNTSNGSVFYGLTFAPAGVLGSGEVLVGANTAGQLYSIVQSGNGVTLTQHGTFGNVPANDGQGHSYPANRVGKAWELSGNIVFVKGTATSGPVGFATVRDCDNPPASSSSTCNATDTLIEINVGMLQNATIGSVTQAVRGQVVKSGTCNDPNNTGYGSMFGIAASGSNVFGFAHAGSIVQIDNTNGSACLVQSTPNQKWDGAAITTVASVVPPPIM